MKNTRKFTIGDILGSLRPEFFIMLTIIVMMCWQLTLADRLSNHGVLVINDHGGVSMITDKSSINDEKTLGNFDLDTCRLIAVYDSEMHPIMKVNFVNDDDAVYGDTYPDDVMSGLNREGNFNSKAPDGTPIRIAYKWYTDEKGHELFTVYTSNLIKEEMKTQRVVISYVVIILCFVMLALITYWQMHGITNNYRDMMLKSRRY